MKILLVFAVVLLLGVLLSELASRSILSTAVIFLVGGFLAGQNVLSLTELAHDDKILEIIAELALFSVLFTDGMRIGVRELASAWRLPGRALLFGMPLTLLITALLAHLLAGLSWLESFLVGAVLAPTDPVFASAIVGREEVPERLRRLLNVESGLNDGLALPIVLILLTLVSREQARPTTLLVEVVLGVLLGVLIPAAVIWLESRPFFKAHEIYEPLLAFSISLLLYASSKLSHANPFLAAFAGGVTVASMSEEARDDFHQFGATVTELLKLGALFMFGAVIQPGFFVEFGWPAYVFAFSVLLIARPAALGVSLAGSPLNWREWAAAAWFGPKGFASVVYAILILQSGADRATHLFHLLSIIIAISMVLHSSTDVVIARWFRRTGVETGVI
jgi:NhaP-type Na+/H+ or K+/H+ antiporter